MTRLLSAVLAAASIALTVGCGRPKPAPLQLEEVTNPQELFATNCQGCHGAKGVSGPAPHISDPLYLKLTSKDSIRKVITEGRRGTPMPVFAASLGGTLSDKQINALVDGIENAWAAPLDLHGAELPPYTEADSIAAGLQPGDPERGRAAYQTFCFRCHGSGTGKSLVGSVTNPAFLALVSDQGLRTTVIVGRPDLGMPDWRRRAKDHAMSNQEISDVVAWLVAQRPAYSSVPQATASLPMPSSATTAKEPKP
jgi:cytochrome c oxidase cbb3-type subunit III